MSWDVVGNGREGCAHRFVVVGACVYTCMCICGLHARERKGDGGWKSVDKEEFQGSEGAVVCLSQEDAKHRKIDIANGSVSKLKED